MQIHTKLYYDYFGIKYDIATGFHDPVSCTIQYEGCTQISVDIHHIEPKGMGGSKVVEVVENYISGCRNCHDAAHDEKISKERLYDLQFAKMVLFKEAQIKVITDKMIFIVTYILKASGIIFNGYLTKFYEIEVYQEHWIALDVKTGIIDAIKHGMNVTIESRKNVTTIKNYIGHNKKLLCSPEELKDLLELIQEKTNK